MASERDMTVARTSGGAALERAGDLELADLARAGDEGAVRTIIRRNNQRLFRAARAIVDSDAEAEDVVQAGYVRAFTRLDSFRGESGLATWLTRIVLNEALSRLRRRRPTVDVEGIATNEPDWESKIIPFPGFTLPADPEAEMSRSEVRHFLERAIDELPMPFRAVFVLRDVQGLSTEEVASELGIKAETAKTRLFRARRMLRRAIAEEVSGAFAGIFPFDGARCVNMADRVLAELAALRAKQS